MDNLTNLVTLSAADAESQKRYRAVGFAMFFIAVSLLLVRTAAYLIGSVVYEGELENEILVDTLFDLGFSLAVQIGVLLVGVFLIYKYALRMNAREILKFSNFRNTKWFNYALSVPLGILALFVTIGVSTAWLVFIIAMGYTPRSSGELMPEVFNPGLFLLALFLTAVLPGVCEEFAMRGGFFTTMKKSYKGGFFYIVMAIAFGLFHQNILQVFYTALFGAVMAFIVVKTKSIYPCMIVHFLNNGTSVYLSYAEEYGWFGGDILNTIFNGILENFALVFLSYLLVLGAFIGLLVLMNFLNPSDKAKKKRAAAPYAGYYGGYPGYGGYNQGYGGYPRGYGNYNQGYGYQSPYPNTAAITPNAAEEHAAAAPDAEGKEGTAAKLYKPSLRDKAFLIGAIVTTALFTVFSFVWGLFY